MPIAISFNGAQGSGFFIPFLYYLQQHADLKASIYWGLYALGFLIALIGIYRHWPREVPKKHLWIGFVGVVLTGLYGAKLFAVFFETPEVYLRNPWLVLVFWRGNTAFYGGLILAILFVLIYMRVYRIGMPKMLDVCTPWMLLGVAVASLGCWFAGCCHGLPTTLPWGLTREVPHDGVSWVFLHPTQLYQVLGRGLAFYYAWRLSQRPHSYRGQVFLHGVGAYAVVRVLTEIFRGDHIRGFVVEGWISSAQAISLSYLLFLGLFEGWRWYRRRFTKGFMAVGHHESLAKG